MNLRLPFAATALLLAASLGLAAQAPPAPKSPAPAAAKGKPKRYKAVPAGQLVDINGATKEELKKLPGVTDTYADKIIAGRPYLTKAHLVTHNVLPAGLYESIKKRIVAKQKPQTR